MFSYGDSNFSDMLIAQLREAGLTLGDCRGFSLQIHSSHPVETGICYHLSFVSRPVCQKNILFHFFDKRNPLPCACPCAMDFMMAMWSFHIQEQCTIVYTVAWMEAGEGSILHRDKRSICWASEAFFLDPVGLFSNLTTDSLCYFMHKSDNRQ